MNPGSRIGQYRILRKLGVGGMGAVYLAEHTLIGRRAAIKALLPSLSAERDIVDRFFNEARATSAIADPGIVQVFDFGFHVDGTAYIVMELLEGEALDLRIRRLGRLVPADALRVIRQAAGSLAAAHACGIVHRDIKPENIFMVRDAEAQAGERPKILDFGIAKLGTEADGWMTQTGAMLGTPMYMSPEQCRGAGNVDARSDIYALGCVLFHMLTGAPPFSDEGSGEVIASHLREPAPAPSSRVPEIPHPVDDLVLHCLEKDPDERYQSMGDLQIACSAVLARISSPGVVPEMPVGELLLAAGFRSVYDGRLAPITPVDSRTLGDDSGFFDRGDLLEEVELETRRRNPLHLVAAILLVGGAVATAIAMRVANEDFSAGTDEAAVIEPAPPALYASTAAVAPPPSAPLPPEPPPPAPPVVVDAGVMPPLALPEEEAPPPPPAAKRKPERKRVAQIEKKRDRPPRAERSKRPHRSTRVAVRAPEKVAAPPPPKKAAPKKKPTQDLYDSR